MHLRADFAENEDGVRQQCYLKSAPCNLAHEPMLLAVYRLHSGAALLTRSLMMLCISSFGTLALIPAQTASASTAANTLQYVGASCSKSRKLTTANPRTHAARQQHDVAGTRARDVRPLPRHSPPSS